MKRFLAGTLVLALAAVGLGQTVLFDATPAGGYWTSANNLEGQVFQLSQSNQVLTGFDMDMVASGTAGTQTVYTDVQLMVTFFANGVTTFSGSSDPEFSNPLGTYTYDLGAQTFSNGYYYTLTGTAAAPFFSLGSGITVTGNQISAQFCWLADTGSGLGAATQIQTAVNLSGANGTGGTPPAVGSNPTAYQLLFGTTGATTSATSLTQDKYLYTGDQYQNLAIKFYGNPVPEPASMAVLGLGVLALIRRRRSTKA